MQLRFIDLAQLADTIRDADMAAHIDSPGGELVHVLRYGGQEMIAVQNAGETVVVVEADNDGEGSIHAQVALGALGDALVRG